MKSSDNKSFLRSVPPTYLVQGLGVILGVIFLKLASQYLNVDEFGALLISRRWIAFIAPLLTLNLTISLSRYPSLDPENAKKYFLITFLISISLFLVLALFTLLFNEAIIPVIWTRNDLNQLVIPTLFLIIATSVQLISVSYWRGLQKFPLMNMGAFIFKLLPVLVIFALWVNGVSSWKLLEEFLLLLAAGLLVFHITSFLFTGSFRSSLKVENFGEFFNYGVSRLPGSLFYLAFFWFPVFYTSSMFDLEAAALVGILIAVMNLFALAASPASLLILPKFAEISVKESKDVLLKKIISLYEFVFHVPVLLGPLVLLFSDELIKLWFGTDYLDAIVGVKIVSLGIPGLMVYVFLRSILDGIEKKPFTNRATFSGLLTLAIVVIFLKPLGYDAVIIASWGIMAGLITLGLSSFYYLVKIFKDKLQYSGVLQGLIILIFSFIISFGLNNLSYNTLWISLIVKSGILLVLMSVFYGYYAKTKPEWYKILRGGK